MLHLRLARAFKVDGDDLPRAPVREPQPAVMPARRLGHGEAVKQYARLHERSFLAFTHTDATGGEDSSVGENDGAAKGTAGSSAAPFSSLELRLCGVDVVASPEGGGRDAGYEQESESARCTDGGGNPVEASVHSHDDRSGVLLGGKRLLIPVMSDVVQESRVPTLRRGLSSVMSDVVAKGRIRLAAAGR